MDLSRMLPRELVHRTLGSSIGCARQLEQDRFVTGSSPWSYPFELLTTPSNFTIHLPLKSRALDLDADLARSCKGKLHTVPDLEHWQRVLGIWVPYLPHLVNSIVSQ